jgi:hypothetical protein
MNYYCPICEKLIECSYPICTSNDHRLVYQRECKTFGTKELFRINLPPPHDYDLVVIINLSKIMLLNSGSSKSIISTNDSSVIKDFSIEELNNTVDRLLMLSRLQ